MNTFFNFLSHLFFPFTAYNFYMFYIFCLLKNALINKFSFVPRHQELQLPQRRPLVRDFRDPRHDFQCWARCHRGHFEQRFR